MRIRHITANALAVALGVFIFSLPLVTFVVGLAGLFAWARESRIVQLAMAAWFAGMIVLVLLAGLVYSQATRT